MHLIQTLHTCLAELPFHSEHSKCVQPFNTQLHDSPLTHHTLHTRAVCFTQCKACSHFKPHHGLLYIKAICPFNSTLSQTGKNITTSSVPIKGVQRWSEAWIMHTIPTNIQRCAGTSWVTQSEWQRNWLRRTQLLNCSQSVRTWRGQVYVHWRQKSALLQTWWLWAWHMYTKSTLARYPHEIPKQREVKVLQGMFLWC